MFLKVFVEFDEISLSPIENSEKQFKRSTVFNKVNTNDAFIKLLKNC